MATEAIPTDDNIKKLSQDLLQRSPIAAAMGRAILSHTESRSLVLGLHGCWGSGKSSVLRMTKDYLEQQTAEQPESQRPIVVTFNPWLVADQNALIQQFFDHFIAALGRWNVTKARKHLARYMKTCSSILAPVGLAPSATGKAVDLIHDRGVFVRMLIRIDLRRVCLMIARLDNLRKHAVFGSLTGLTVAAFDELAAELVPVIEAAHTRSLARPDRKRAIGGGDNFDLSTADQLLLAVIWLRQYPTNETLGFLFGVSDSTASRVRTRCLPVLERAGRDTMRMPDPGIAGRKRLPALLKDTPGLAVVIDSFEQRTQRPKRRLRAYDSGKKKAHTLKSQVAVDEQSGRFVDVSDSVPGPWADIPLLETSRLLKRLPEGGGGIGDLGYVGIGELHPTGLGAAPRRKPRGKERPPEDRKYNRAFRRRRIVVEHAIGRLRRFRAVAHVNRHQRHGHAMRVRAIAGLVNRMLDHRAAT